MVKFRNQGINSQRFFQASKHSYFIDDDWFDVVEAEDIRFFRLNGSFEEEGKPSPVPEAVIKTIEVKEQLSLKDEVKPTKKKRILGIGV